MGDGMRILIVQNHSHAPAGLVGQTLEDCGVLITSIDPKAGQPLPDMTGDYAGLVVLGGAQDAWDDADNPHFHRLMRLICDFHDQDRAVLGICLGAQLTARAFGAKVYRHHTPELGYHPVRLRDEARDDALFAGHGPELHLAQWHYDSFDLPAGAVHLGESDACANQAFRLGRATYGLQFHPEASEDIVRGWMASFGEDAREHNPEILDGMADSIGVHLPVAEKFADQMTRRWLGLVNCRP